MYLSSNVLTIFIVSLHTAAAFFGRTPHESITLSASTEIAIPTHVETKIRSVTFTRPAITETTTEEYSAFVTQTVTATSMIHVTETPRVETRLVRETSYHQLPAQTATVTATLPAETQHHTAIAHIVPTVDVYELRTGEHVKPLVNNHHLQKRLVVDVMFDRQSSRGTSQHLMTSHDMKNTTLERDEELMVSSADGTHLLHIASVLVVVCSSSFMLLC
jgi:hypothetical protein